MHSHDALDGVAFKMTSFDFNRMFMHKLKIGWLLQILHGIRWNEYFVLIFYISYEFGIICNQTTNIVLSRIFDNAVIIFTFLTKLLSVINWLVWRNHSCLIYFLVLTHTMTKWRNITAVIFPILWKQILSHVCVFFTVWWVSDKNLSCQ